MIDPVKKTNRSLLSWIHEWSLILLTVALVSFFCVAANFLFKNDFSGSLFSGYRVLGYLVYFAGIVLGSTVILYLPDESPRWIIAIGRISLRVAVVAVNITLIWLLVYAVIGQCIS